MPPKPHRSRLKQASNFTSRKENFTRVGLQVTEEENSCWLLLKTVVQSSLSFELKLPVKSQGRKRRNGVRTTDKRLSLIGRSASPQPQEEDRSGLSTGRKLAGSLHVRGVLSLLGGV